MKINKVEIGGNVIRDPELRFTPGGVAVCQFTVAIGEPRWDSREKVEKVWTTFVSCEAWDVKAEEIAEAVGKGDEVYIIGSLTQSEFEKQDGTKERKTRVRVATFDVTRSMKQVRHNKPDPNYGPAQEPAGQWGPPATTVHNDEPPF